MTSVLDQHLDFWCFLKQCTFLTLLQIQRLKREWPGSRYNAQHCNCNDFANALCMCLCETPIPKWINRLAQVSRYDDMLGNKPYIHIYIYIYSCLTIFLKTYERFMVGKPNGSTPSDSEKDATSTNTVLNPWSMSTTEYAHVIRKQSR